MQSIWYKIYRKESWHYLLLRIMVALIAAHFIVVHGAKETWAELFVASYYYNSLFGSFIIAFLLTEYVYVATEKLNLRNEGAYLTTKRIKEQFVVGFVGAAFLAFLLAAILFWIHNQNIFKSDYFSRLYIIILLFIFTINIVYVLYDIHKTWRNYKFKLIDQKQLTLPEFIVQACQNNSPAIIYYDNRVYFTLDFNGAKTTWPSSIEDSIEFLAPDIYFQINRYTIVHRSVIAEAKPHEMRFIKITPIIVCAIELVTSKRKTIPFKEWYAEGPIEEIN